MMIPAARPVNAPMAMEGRMMPAGICRPKVMTDRKNPRTAAKTSRTMVLAEAAPVLQRPIWSSRTCEHSENRFETSSVAWTFM